MAEVVEKLKSFSARAQETAKHFLRYENAVLVSILGAIMAVMGVMTKGLTLTAGNLSNVWLQSSTRGIAAIGVLFVMLTAGIDVSVGGTALLSAIFGSAFITDSVMNIIGAPLPMGVGV